MSAKSDKSVVPPHVLRSAGLPVRKKRRLIAIVDDDAYVREAIRGLMRSMGFAAEAFSSAHAFLRSSQLAQTGCLITDVNMPEMNGLDLYYRLSELGSAIPTILITAHPDEDIRALAIESGVIACLVKPFSEMDLLDGVRVALSLQQ
jgi:FixJ family two-component response regulator